MQNYRCDGDVLKAALAYLEAGFSVIPCHAKSKRPAIPSWKQFEERRMTPQEAEKAFRDAEAIGMICGAVSGNLECPDFDCRGVRTFPFFKRVLDERPHIVEAGYFQKTQSGGDHFVYRCEAPVDGNRKLAVRPIRTDGAGSFTYRGQKPQRTIHAYGEEIALFTTIETRGEGGYFLTDPSPGYERFSGVLSRLKPISKSDRDYLMQVALDLNEWTPPRPPKPASKPVSLPKPGRTGGSVIEAFNAQMSPMLLLEQAGWIRAGGEGTAKHGGHAVRVRRPGKEQEPSGAVIDDRIFVCFSTNAPPFEETRSDRKKGYNAFQVYSMLNHGGDHKQAARDLWQRGYR